MTVLEPVVYVPSWWELLAAQNDATHAENGVLIDRIQAKLDRVLGEPDPDWFVGLARKRVRS